MKYANTFLAGFFILLCTSGAIAQGLYHKGTLHLKKGKEKEVYIEIDFGFPQRFQQGITYVEPKDWAKYQKTGKLKGKMKQKMEPKHFESFSLEDGRVFETIWYTDLTGRAIKMIPKRMTLERIADGPIKMYKLYSRTTGKINHELADYVMGNRDELIHYIQNNFQLLIHKHTKHPKNVQQINLLNYIGDNARVKENYDSNHYGLRNQFSAEHKMGIYVGKEYEAAFLRLVEDYNRDTGAAR
ncbi:MULTISPECIES: hypothetical protein [unclassified Robiginitalea]|uniref:hypothetical protein n=1 Tax=Robiginitalea TaxID=252306 RepID=UPI0023491699|nr:MULTISPECIES: hypothetical protein [unclassified Robiginitalea]MDC6353607.1 hypothetical protein [Robiginitalea sp. PM2]MDC6373228.1 hypothetical protein [Robiginitalea sp. SP8]